MPLIFVCFALSNYSKLLVLKHDDKAPCAINFLFDCIEEVAEAIDFQEAQIAVIEGDEECALNALEQDILDMFDCGNRKRTRH